MANNNDITLLNVLNSSQSIPYQGPCVPRQIDQHFSTATCYGGSSGMINIEYQDNTRVCVYIDHLDNQLASQELFIPLRTLNEWQHFRDTVFVSGYRPYLRPVCGCPAQKIQDECHQYQSMPDARDGTQHNITSAATYQATYTCNAPCDFPANITCGSWQLAGSSGTCPTTDGVCGTAVNRVTHNPPTVNLCGWGTPSAPVLSGSYFNWTCAGDPGGKTASCRAVHSAEISCGPDYKGYFSDLNAFSPGLCAKGNWISDFKRNGGVWTWMCNSGGGVSQAFAACHATYQPSP